MLTRFRVPLQLALTLAVLGLGVPQVAASEVPLGTLVIVPVDATGRPLMGRCFVLYGQEGGERWLETSTCDRDDSSTDGWVRFTVPAATYTVCESRVPLRVDAPSWTVAVAGQAITTLTLRLAPSAGAQGLIRWPPGEHPRGPGLPCPV